jgi:hypothetical protein
MKLHAIIEKTAKFIASHGNQMEIILKTKQSGNLLFNFLEYRDVLNPYYKFLVQAIRSNAYNPTSHDSAEVQLDSPAPAQFGKSEFPLDRAMRPCEVPIRVSFVTMLIFR